MLYARAAAVIYALLTVLGMIPVTNTAFGRVPIYGHDVWLHAVLAVVAAYFGFVEKNGPRRQRPERDLSRSHF